MKPEKSFSFRLLNNGMAVLWIGEARLRTSMMFFCHA